MAERVADLIYKANLRGVPVNGSMTKDDLERELCKFWELENPGFYLPQIAVMLAKDAKDLSEAELEHMLDDDSWAMEIKYDGARFKLHILEGRFHFDSRNRSVEDYHYKNRSAVLTHMLDLNYAKTELEGTVLDGEFVYDNGESGKLNKAVSISNTDPLNISQIVWANGKVNYIAFDIIKYQGEDVTDQPFEHRRQLLLEVVADINKPTIKTSEMVIDNKNDRMDEWIGKGFEGVMFKDRSAPYTYKKRVRDQYKLKRTLRFDAIVTGFKPAKDDRAFAGLVGAIEFSINIQGLGMTPIAYCQPGTVAFREAISASSGAGVTMMPNMYGKCAEIIGMNFTVNGFLSHARIVKWNEGADFNDVCLYQPWDKRFKKSMYFRKG